MTRPTADVPFPNIFTGSLVSLSSNFQSQSLFAFSELLVPLVIEIVLLALLRLSVYPVLDALHARSLEINESP